MTIRKNRRLKRTLITAAACSMVMMLASAVYAEEGNEGIEENGIEEINKAYDYTVVTGGDAVGASAGISSGGWASLGSKLSYMQFPEDTESADGEDGVWCYCIDISTDTENGHKYSVTTLDAAQYYEKEAADKIRSILLNSYPNMDIEQLEQTYQLSELMEEEAFMATQWILWYYSNPDGMVEAGEGKYYPANIYKPSEYPRETITMWYDDEQGNEMRTQSSNIVKLAKALDALAPAAAYETEPAAIAFEKKVYDDRVVFDYAGSKGLETLEGIEITVKDGQGKAVPFEVKGTQIIIKRSVVQMSEGAAKLTVSLAAVQDLVKDVYFFAPEGGRDASQSRVAVYSGTAPVSNDVVFDLTVNDFEEGEEYPKDPVEPTDPTDPAAPEGSAENPGAESDGTPATGDDFGVIPVVVLAVSLGGIVAILLRKKYCQ